MKTYLHAIKYSFTLIWKSGRVILLAYVFLCFFSPLLSLQGSYAFSILVKYLTEGRESNVVIWRTVIFCCIAVLVYVLNFSKNNVYEILYSRTRFEYDCIIRQKISVLPFSIIDSSSGKDEISEMIYNTVPVVHLSDNIIKIFSSVVTFLVTCFAFFSYKWYIAIVFLLLTVPYSLINSKNDLRIELFRRSHAADIRRFSYYRWMLTDPAPAADIRLYDLSDDLLPRYDEEKRQFIKENKKIAKYGLIVSILCGLLKYLGEATFTVSLVYSAFAGTIDAGQFVYLFTIGNKNVEAFKTAADLTIYSFTRTTKRLKKLKDFISYEDENTNKSGIIAKTFETLVFENVFFKYPFSDNYVLKDISFTIKKGGRFSIVGVNGAGKTTIVNLILGFYKPNEGRILLNGIPYEEYNLQSIRRLFSAMTQDFAKYPLTFAENIAMSDIDRVMDNKSIIQVMKKIDSSEEILSKVNFNLSTGMTRMLDDNGIELSKGQWQKVGLARTFFKNAYFCIFDEPSSALDVISEHEFYEKCEELSKDITILFISHRLSTTKKSDLILVLDGGAIVEQGSFEQLIAQKGLYYEMYSTQIEKF